MMGWKRRAIAVLLLASSSPGSAFAQALASGPETPAGPPAAQDQIFWYPAPSRCTYFTPDAKRAFRYDDPDTWRFAFLVMRETKGEKPVERGYVMVDGTLRELEMVRTGADANQSIVTVWRSPGEPRVNVNVTVSETGREGEAVSLAGRMTLIRGEGRKETEIEGTCSG
ncbi:hypothetical protein [Aureimonas sp. ME7]|uniref:hypothetical protein n=1 Tax=Aureimonas sp. ME7 TaxID=2744252 RepID=UPI0015F64FD9|nr:hypothetical protein [Aureimonas sp. ME7]